MKVFGYFQSEKGVGAAARSVLRALRYAEIAHSVHTVHDGGSENIFPRPVGKKLNYPIELFAFLDYETLLSWKSESRSRYRIGFLAWELAEFPIQWKRALGLFDEIWTFSQFTAKCFSKITSVPVHVFPLSVELPEISLHRSKEFTFLTSFDFHSSIDRKDPFSTIEAFSRANVPGKLIIKTMHGKQSPRDLERLQAAIRGNPRIELIDQVFSTENYEKLMRNCDAYLSLHRAEGFGLPLAEAMALGKPVIATGFSGNRDFMDETTAFLIPYDLIPIQGRHPAYSKGEWAQADVEIAARAMRYVYENKEKAREIGQLARKKIEEVLSVRVVSGLINSRLVDLSRELSSRKSRRTPGGFHRNRFQMAFEALYRLVPAPILRHMKPRSSAHLNS